MTIPGQGGQQPAPLNAPPAGAVATGVQPGVSNAVVLATYVIVFGTNGGVFVYSGTPGPGDLIASVTSATADPYGNATNPGICSYGADGSYALLSESNGTAYLALMPPGASTISTPPYIEGDVDNPGLANEYSYLYLSSGIEKNESSGQMVQWLTSESDDGSIIAAFAFIAPGSNRILFGNADGFSPGNATILGNLPVNQTDTTQHSVVNNAFGLLSKAYSITANDAGAADIYRLTVSGNGSQGAAVQTLTFAVTAFGTNYAAVTVGGTAFVASADFSWTVTCDFVILSSGAAGTAFAKVSGTIGEFGSNQSSSNGNSTAFVGQQSGITGINTTAATTISLAAEWGAITDSPEITSFYSTLERIGP